MKEQDQIYAIAQLDGWTERDERWFHVTYSEGQQGIKFYNLPDYFHSRDAIVPVIEKQNDMMHCSINYWLTINLGYRHGFLVLPAHLCEALLRATARWKE